MSELLGDIRDVNSLTDAQVLSIMKRASQIKKFLEEVAEEAMARAMASKPVPGTKLVAGRSSRAWVPGAEAKIVAILEGDGEDISTIADTLYEPQKIKSPAALEKDIGAKKFASLESLVKKSDGKPTLVFEDDPRPAVDLKKDKKDLFKEDWE